MRDFAHIQPDPHLSGLLTGYGEETLAQSRRNASSLRTDVENAITPLLPHGKARLDETARRLGMSNRTLARRLTADGHGFAEILDALRSDLAVHYLTEPALSISKIAWLLGYNEVSAFTHAFKRWTGKGPRAIRQVAIA